MRRYGVLPLLGGGYCYCFVGEVCPGVVAFHAVVAQPRVAVAVLGDVVAAVLDAWVAVEPHAVEEAGIVVARS